MIEQIQVELEQCAPSVVMAKHILGVIRANMRIVLCVEAQKIQLRNAGLCIGNEKRKKKFFKIKKNLI